MDEIKSAVRDILGEFSGLDKAKKLFAELNYEVVRDTLPTSGWNKAAKEGLAENPQVIASHGPFCIVYSRLASEKLLLTPERNIITALLREHPYSLFLFSTEDQKEWHFVNVKLARSSDDVLNKEPSKRRLFRRITVRYGDRRLRTAAERLSLLDLAKVEPELFDIPPLSIQHQHNIAFDVEAVTKEFYDSYETVFKELWDDLKRQTGDNQWSHDYALQFHNRIMFLYFVQRKGWLAEDSEFLEAFWKAYNKSSQPKNTFFEKWLKVLFFEAFNNQKNLLNTEQRAYLPEDIRKSLWEAPFLNGGLFKKNRLDFSLDNETNVTISDQQFTKIFDLFQQYNFTITEDSPLDKEVAVDPEMIGKVYESLVNLSEAGIERSAAGIFYTPRTEIDLMCRLSMVDNLANHLGDEHKNLFYEVVFSLDPEDKARADKALAEAGLWPDVEQRLNEIKVLDPACGSGSFLVGILYVLNDLLERAEKQRGKQSDSYERKKRIIGQSLYGVDVMDWACHVAELRLWLSLIVDAQFSKEELSVRKQPLLPHFSFKVRYGDSLVQEVGGVDLSHRRGPLELTSNARRRLNDLRKEKAKFYNNDKSCRFKSVAALESHEVTVFREMLRDRVNVLNKEAEDLMRIQAEEKAYQQRSLISGELEGPSRQFTFKREQRERQITELKARAAGLEAILETIRGKENLPFVWDIAFAEIFSGDNHGFDVVIGNPPYVRQEKIANPILTAEQVTNGNKKEYKAKLARSVYSEYPSFFGYDFQKEKSAQKIGAKSDLYIYFYFHGLSLLNDKGSFCFITSNSWLDVGYGKDLQEFLLKRCHVKIIIDNKAKRSFKESDVNTVIVLFSPPAASKTPDDVLLKKTARFVMFYVPFEEVLDPVVFEEIDETGQKKTCQEYRVFPVKQAELLLSGCEVPQEDMKNVQSQMEMPYAKIARYKYIGNKWGGKYLRAPDIYWTILEKGKDKLVRLGDIAEVRFGIKTGANEFFYLDDEKIKEWGIEEEFLKPVIFSLKEIRCIEDSLSELRYFMFQCHKPMRQIKSKNVIKYIKWGQQQGFDERPTCKSRVLWYSIGQDWISAPFIFPAKIGERMVVLRNKKGYLEDKKLYGVTPYKGHLTYWAAILNSTLCRLFMDLSCRQLTGAQAIADVDVQVVESIKLPKEDRINIEALGSRYDRMAKRPIEKHVRDEYSRTDRYDLDDVIFDSLELTRKEQDAVYEAVIDLVESRLKKAESQKGYK